MSGWITVFLTSNLELLLDVARLISYVWLEQTLKPFGVVPCNKTTGVHSMHHRLRLSAKAHSICDTCEGGGYRQVLHGARETRICSQHILKQNTHA